MVKPNAAAALRNSRPILDVIREEFRECKTILEIGSGTGQHAVFFGSEMPTLSWQTSDLKENHDGINAWIADAKLDNVLVPIELDVRNPPPIEKRFDGVFSANTAHIMNVDAVANMFRVIGQCLNDGGRFCLYGPFNLNGEFTSNSNKQFDASLKSQNPEMGVRDLEVLDEFAEANGLRRTNLYAMPANNMIAVWDKN